MKKTTSKCKFIPHPQLNTSTNSNGTNSSLYKTMNDMTEQGKPPKIVIRTRNWTRTVKGESLFKNVTRLKFCNKKTKIIPLSLPKQSLLKGVKDLEFINKPMNVKLNKILNEENMIMRKNKSKTNNFSFDFRIFEEPSMRSENSSFREKKERCEMRCHTPEKDIRYLRNYSLIIRNKILNESKANNYLQKLRNILKIKENKYKSVNKLLNSTIISCDEDKIKQSLEIDAHIERMNFLQMITEDNLITHSPTKVEREHLISESKVQTNRIIKEMDTLFTESKENELISKNKEKDLNSFAQHLHFEIKHLKKEISACMKISKEYYIDLLSKGNDIRSEGISWIVRKLLQLEYTPKRKDFPKYYDDRSCQFVIKLAKKQNENSILIEQLKNIKSDILSMDSENKKFGENLEKSLKRNLSSYKTKKNEGYIIKKMEELLTKHEYCHVTPFQEEKIQFCLKTPNINKYRIKLKQSKGNFNFNPRPKSVKVSSKGNQKIVDKIFNKNHYNFESNKQYKLLKQIIDIKQKIKDNEYQIDRLKGDQLEYVQSHKLDSYDLLVSLFGNANKYKYT